MTDSNNTNAPGASRGEDEIALIAGKLIHEIKNPLNAIYLNLQLLDEEWRNETGAKQQRLNNQIAILKEESRRLREVLDDFLRFARSSIIVEKKPYDLNETVNAVVDFTRPEAMARGVRILTAYASPPPVSDIDRNLFKQALLNLILNALDALEKGGDVIVKTLAADGCALVDVSDTGPGMSEEQIKKIFEPFYTTKANGSGLGLPATRKIIEAHGGEISVQSAPGRGTNFRIRLPLSSRANCGGLKAESQTADTPQ
jgi:signal transduction histidine kinase